MIYYKSLKSILFFFRWNLTRSYAQKFTHGFKKRDKIKNDCWIFVGKDIAYLKKNYPKSKETLFWMLIFFPSLTFYKMVVFFFKLGGPKTQKPRASQVTISKKDQISSVDLNICDLTLVNWNISTLRGRTVDMFRAVGQGFDELVARGRTVRGRGGPGPSSPEPAR